MEMENSWSVFPRNPLIWTVVLAILKSPLSPSPNP